jgi:Na+/proline symporter
MLFFKLQGLMGAAFWLGLFWRRMTVAGAWSATLAAFVVLIATGTTGFHTWASGQLYTDHATTPKALAQEYQFDVDELLAVNPNFFPDSPIPTDTLVQIAEPALPDTMVLNGKFRDPWQIFSYLVAGFSTGIIVSLLTKRVDEGKLDKVYRALRTPVMEDEPHSSEPFTIPEGIKVPEPRKLINHPELEIPMPTAVGMGGFVGIWAIVALLIGFVFWMATWGA